jgi:thymidylate synthase ThyX
LNRKLIVEDKPAETSTVVDEVTLDEIEKEITNCTEREKYHFTNRATLKGMRIVMNLQLQTRIMVRIRLLNFNGGRVIFKV